MVVSGLDNASENGQETGTGQYANAHGGLRQEEGTEQRDDQCGEA